MNDNNSGFSGVVRALPLTFIILIGFFLRFYNLSAKNLWLDEIATLKRAGSPWSWLQVYANESPLYYQVLKVVKIIMPSDLEWAARFPAAVFGVLLIPAVYFMARKWSGQYAALAMALLAALSPLQIYYSQEARFYSAFALFTCLAHYLCLKVLEKKSLSLLFAWSLATWINLENYKLAWLIFAVHFIWIVWAWFFRNKEVKFDTPSRPELRRPVWLILALFPILAAISDRIGDLGLRIYQLALDVAPIQASGLVEWEFTGILGYLYYDKFKIILFIINIVLITTGIVIGWRQPKLRMLVACTVGTILLPFLLFGLFLPALLKQPRYLIFIQPLSLLLISFCFIPLQAFRLNRTKIKSALLAVLVIMFAGLVFLQARGIEETYSRPKGAWREAMAYLGRNISPGDVVIATDSAAKGILFDYAGFNDISLFAVILPETEEQLENLIERSGRAFVVTRLGRLHDDEEIEPEIRRWLLKNFYPIRIFNKYGIIVYGYHGNDEPVPDFIVRGAPDIRYARDIEFPGGVYFRGLSCSPEVLVPGRKARLTFYWQAGQELEDVFRVTGRLIAEDVPEKALRLDHDPVNGIYPTIHWREPDLIRDTMELDIPADFPEGFAFIELGLWANDRGFKPMINKSKLPYNALCVLEVNSREISSYILDYIPKDMTVVGTEFREGVELVGYNYDIKKGQSGNTQPGINIDLFWRVDKHFNREILRIKTHLIRKRDNHRINLDHTPFPFSQDWKSGAIVKDTVTFNDGDFFKEGLYWIESGLWNPETETGPRSVSSESIGSKTGWFAYPEALGYVYLEALPPGAVPLEKPLAMPEGVTLAAYQQVYDIENIEKNRLREIELILYWKTNETVSSDYAIILRGDADPSIGTYNLKLDHSPLEGRLPTSMWPAGKYVVDRVKVVLPDDAPLGSYNLRTSFWHPKKKSPSLSAVFGKIEFLQSVEIEWGFE